MVAKKHVRFTLSKPAPAWVRISLFSLFCEVLIAMSFLPKLGPGEATSFEAEFPSARSRLSDISTMGMLASIYAVGMQSLPSLVGDQRLAAAADSAGNFAVVGLTPATYSPMSRTVGAMLLKQRQEVAYRIGVQGHTVGVPHHPLGDESLLPCRPIHKGPGSINVDGAAVEHRQCTLPSCPYCLSDEILRPLFYRLETLLTCVGGGANDQYTLAIRQCDLSIGRTESKGLVQAVNDITRSHKRKLDGCSAIQQLRLLAPGKTGSEFSIRGANGYSVRLIDLVLLPGKELEDRLSRIKLRKLEKIKAGFLEIDSHSADGKRHMPACQPRTTTSLEVRYEYSMLRSPTFGLPDVFMQPNRSQLLGLLPSAIVVPPTWFTANETAIAAMHLQLGVLKSSGVRFRRIATNSVKSLAEKTTQRPARELPPVELTLTQPKLAEVELTDLKSAYESDRLSLEQKYGLIGVRDFVRHLNASYKETDSASSSISRTPVELRNALHGDQRRTHGAESLQGSSGSGTSDHLCGVGSSGDGGGNTFCGVG